MTLKFQTVANNILNGDPLPKTWQEAFISMIPKTELNAPSVKDFRPISLLNVDYKIFSKIIEERLKKTVDKIIMKDQAGFLPNRNIKDNLRIVLDILEYGEKTPGGGGLAYFFLMRRKPSTTLIEKDLKRNEVRRENGESYK